MVKKETVKILDKKTVKLTDNSEYHWSADEDSLLDRHENNISRDTGCFKDKLKNWREVESDVRNRMKQAAVVTIDASGYEHNTEDLFLAVIGSENSYVLTTGNLVGEVVCEGGGKGRSGFNRVQISSRFGDSFLRYLLMDADGFLPIDGGGITKSDTGIDWMLWFAWAAKLRGAFRFGLPKQYETKAERLPFVRGRLDVIDYSINRSTGRYLCEYRRQSCNNMVTKLIYRVFDILGNRGINASPDMQMIRQSLVQATEGQKEKDSRLLETKGYTNPLYMGYNSVINFSKLIIRRMSGDLGDGVEMSSFLFDMSMLFEYYVRKLLGRNGFLMIEKNEDSFATISRGLYDEERKLKPDILFRTGDGLYVFDVKYKYFSTMPGQGGVERDDLYQLHTYVGRYGKDSPISGCGFIYPVKECRWESDFHFDANKGCDGYHNEICQHDKKIPFHVVFIKIPNDTEGIGTTEVFNEYVARIQSSETDFLKEMMSISLKK